MSRPLPPILAEIAEVISFQAAMRLAEAKGGQRISIPSKVYEGHWLVEVLGMKDATAFSNYFTNGSNVYLDVPFGPTSFRARREARIAKMIEEGKSANEIAAANQITRRYVFEKKRQHKAGENSSLPDLFDQLK